MNRISQVSSNLKAKPPVYEKQVPKTDETKLQQKIDTLLPNDLHNLESPGTYLDLRRSEATVNKSNFEKLLVDPLLAEIKDKVYKAFENNPEFQIKNNFEMELSEHRLYTNKVFAGVIKAINFTPEDFEKHKDYLIYLMIVTGGISNSAATKIAVHFGLYIGTLLKLGTQKHLDFAHKAMELKNLGCFGLTELAHGSNVQSILTTATYSHKDRSFILNTPHELGMKYWIGNLAKTANYGVIFANLIVDDQNHGVHVFHIQIRDDKGNLLPGVQVGDIGHKLGMNGVDNGWVIFRRVKLPYDALLDRYSQIDNDGNFTSVVKKKTERFALQLAALSSGRLIVGLTSGLCTLIAGSITTRYLSVRKQFGAKKYQEETLITYPLVQSRLFPQLALGAIYFFFSEELSKQWVRTDISKVGDKNVKELHALASAIKCLSSWHALESFNIFRELCGGHGYSADSLIPSIIVDQNVQVTWEGTNDVLIQQTAKFILNAFSKYMQKGEIHYQTFEFLRNYEDENYATNLVSNALNTLSSLDLKNIDTEKLLVVLKQMMQLRMKVVSEVVAERFLSMTQDNTDLFHAYNKTLPNAIMDACMFYGDYKAFENYESFLNSKKSDATFNNELIFLKRLLTIGMVARLKQKSHYFSGKVDIKFFSLLDEISLELHNSIVNDVVVFTDAVNLPDWLMTSTLGKSDGDVYRNIISKIYSRGENFGKSEHLVDILKIRGLK